MFLARLQSLLPSLCVALLVLSAVGCATTPSNAPVVYTGSDPGPQLDWREAERAVHAIRSYEFGDSREPLAAVHELVRDAMHSPESSARLAAILGDALEGRGSVDAKRFVCRELSLIGSAAQVPQLTALLADPALADSARYALDRLTFSLEKEKVSKEKSI